MPASTRTQTRRHIIARMDALAPRPGIDGPIMTVSRLLRDGAEKGGASIRGSAARDRSVAPWIRGPGSMGRSAAPIDWIERIQSLSMRSIDGSLLGSAAPINPFQLDRLDPRPGIDRSLLGSAAPINPYQWDREGTRPGIDR